MMPLELIVVLYAVGLALVAAELFVPGVVIGVIGSLCLLASIYGTFTLYGPLAGAIQLLGTVVIVGVGAVFGLKRLQLRTEFSTAAGYRSSDAQLEALIGEQGRAVTQLRPAGIVELGGRRVDVVTAGELIEPGATVRVVKVEGNRVVVRGIAEGPRA